MSANQGSPDARPLSVAEVLAALHEKFSVNFHGSTSLLDRAASSESKARSLSACTGYLQRISGYAHQRLLATYVDEIFGDSVCSLYLASCGLTVPARMLLRRSLELGLVVVAYWDAPAEFWQWRDHDGDIRFTTVSAFLSSPGYVTFLNNLPRKEPVDGTKFLGSIPVLYGELSDVVHPKPYNFATKHESRYAFDEGDFVCTMALAERVYSALVAILKARFPELPI